MPIAEPHIKFKQLSSSDSFSETTKNKHKKTKTKDLWIKNCYGRVIHDRTDRKLDDRSKSRGLLHKYILLYNI